MATKEPFKCEKRGCKKKVDELYCKGPYGTAKDKRWFCEGCFKRREEPKPEKEDKQHE